MRSLNPDQLRTFIEVVERGSFTAAAKELHLSQPAVSLQIRELEARCGVSLLDRLGKKPQPTAAGRQLLVYAKRILSECEEALGAMHRIRDTSGKQLRVGMSMTTLTYFAQETIRRFQRENPKAELVMTMLPSTPLVEEIRAHNLDIAVVSLPIDERQLIVTPFFEDGVVALVPDDQASPMPTAVTPQFLSSSPFVVQDIGSVQARLAQDWFRDSGQSPLRFVEVRNLEACRAAVAAGLGVTIVPGGMAVPPLMKGVVALPLDPPVTRTLALIEHKNRHPNVLANKLKAALIAFAASKGGTRISSSHIKQLHQTQG